MNDRLLTAALVYAIRHKPTESYMPARMFKQSGAGWSYWEPTDVGNKLGLLGVDRNPRLFFSHAAAALAANAWLRGQWECGYGVDGERLSPRPGAPDGPERRAEDIEIVEFKLMEVRSL